MNLVAAMTTKLNTALRQSAVMGFAASPAEFGVARESLHGNDAAERAHTPAFLRRDVLIDCICAFLLSAGIGLLLTAPIIFTPSVLEVLALAALSAVSFAALRIRWWFGPLLGALTLGGGALYLYRSEQLSDFVYRWGALFTWLRWGDLEELAFVGSAEMVHLTYLMLFGVTLAIFLMLRRAFSIWLIVAAFGGALMVPYSLMELNLAPPLILFAAGVVILLPRVFARSVRGQGLPGGGRTYMQSIALPGAALVVLLGLTITPQSEEHLRWPPLANLFYDVGYFFSPTQSAYTTNFDIHSLGFGVSPDRLGGPVTLADGYIVTVVANKPLLLGGAVKDYYTGYNWVIGEQDSSLRWGSFLWRNQRADAFDLDKPSGGAIVRDAFDAVTTEVTMELTYAAEFYTTLFASAGLRDISLTTSRLTNEIFFNARSELYLTNPVPMGEVVTIHARAINRDAPDFEENFLRLESLVAGDHRFEYIHARYTNLPETLPDSVRQTAWEIVGDETSPFLKATAIAQWLGENFTYTLNPVIPPEDVDFVAHFLETGEGYCTYYATAMAVLARAVGLPSRYVVGLALARESLGSNIFHGSGRTVHAWAEVYFYGIGWIPFDPLDWNADTPLHLPPASAFAFGEFWEEYWYAYWYMIQYGWEGMEIEQLGAFGFGGRNTHFVWITVAAMMVVVLCVVRLWNRKARQYSPARAARKIPGLTERFSFFYADVMEQLRVLGMGIHTGETLSAYSRRLDGTLAVRNLDRVARAQMMLHFARIPPTDADLEAVGNLHAALETALREQISAPKYFWRRVVRPPAKSATGPALYS